MGLLKMNKRWGAIDVHVGHWERGSKVMTSRGIEYEVRTMFRQETVWDYEWEGGARFVGSGVPREVFVPFLTVWEDGEYAGWIDTSTSFVKETTVHFFRATDLSKLRVSDRSGTPEPQRGEEYSGERGARSSEQTPVDPQEH